MGVTKKEFVSGAIWKVIEHFSAKGVSFIVSIILARLLMPEDYGVLALTAVFTNFSDMLIDAGFSTALIRKEKVDEYDYSSVLMTSIGIALILYIALFFSAPFFGLYYNEPLLPKVLRVIGTILFVQAFSSTRNAQIARNMDFKFLFYCNFAACVISGIAGIVLAYLGCGVWALVAQQLSQSVIATILIFTKEKWNFKWKYDTERLLEMLKFGAGVVGSSFINYCASSISSMVIGKHYSVKELGYYDKGAQFPMQFSLYTFGAMSGVLLPTLSSHQSDLAVVKRIIRKVTQMTAFLIVPIMVGMAVTSKELIIILLTEKWMPALKIMQYSCLYYLATPFMLINVQLFFALGHSFLRVKTELIRFALILLSLGLCVWLDWDIYQLALVSAIIAVIAAWITYLEVRKLINYQYREHLHDLFKPIFNGLIMGTAVVLCGKVLELSGNSSVGVLLLAKILVGISVYVLMSVITKPEGYLEGINYLHELLNKRRNTNE